MTRSFILHHAVLQLLGPAAPRRRAGRRRDLWAVACGPECGANCGAPRG